MERTFEITDVQIMPNPVQTGAKFHISVEIKEPVSFPYDYPYDYAMKQDGKKRIYDYPYDYSKKD